MLYAGASRVVITPPLGTTLAGYPGRPQGAQRVYDDIFIRALVLESDGQLYALMTGDLMAVDTAWIDDLRRRASITLGIPESHLMFAASHTHSAIGGLLSFRDSVGKGVEAIFTDVEGRFDEILYEYLLRQAISALALARSALRPCSVSLARGEVSGIASNRIHPERAVDPSCLVLEVTDADSKTVAVVFHYCCHPTTLGSQDLGISGDFPGMACRIVESSLGSGCVALFLNGALGDVSTRFSRRSQTYTEVQRFGRMLGGAVLQALGDTCSVDRPKFSATVESLRLRPKSSRWLGQVEDRAARLRADLAQAEVSRSHGEVRQLKTALQGTENSRRLLEALDDITAIPLSIQRFSLTDNLDFVAIPGEMFSCASDEVGRRFPGRTVRLVGTANGYLGYIPPAAAYEEGGYEVDSAFVEQGSAETIVEQVVTLLH